MQSCSKIMVTATYYFYNGENYLLPLCTEYTPLPSLGSKCTHYVCKEMSSSCNECCGIYRDRLRYILHSHVNMQHPGASYVSEPLIIHAYITCTHSMVSWSLRIQWSPSVAKTLVTNILSLIGVPYSCCKGRQESTESLSIVCIQQGVRKLSIIYGSTVS